MASLLLLLSALVRPKNPNLAFSTAAVLPSSSLASSCAGAISSSHYKKPLGMTDAKKYQSETLAEDVQEPKFCIDLSWP
ncbi:hypothetical protein MANES_01G167500v8 [Manihot esculenta]|uniref:Uncharacterized protein n=1 Tax=Manihot esculenta TaxID=3983 RepID=A0A2C9WLK0_MANES|nr:hypothetical protein MANES_01G167500v8 [Manihot esculenta]